MCECVCFCVWVGRCVRSLTARDTPLYVLNTTTLHDTTNSSSDDHDPDDYDDEK